MKHAPLLALLLIASASPAQQAPRHEGYSALDGLVGRWTIAGQEGTYLETCEWYDGRRHIVCNMQSQRTDGSTARGMSILSFVPGEGYVYTGIGNRGRYETYRRGTYANGIIEYREHSGGVHTRIQVGPFSDENRVPFAVHTSQDGITWKQADAFTYVRVK